MEEPQQEFDVLLGGNQELPTKLNLMRFALARGNEIVEMKNILSTNKSTKLAFQTLPKHMRRRCMSHNSKRLPRRLREKHLNQLVKSGMPQKQKKPSRKQRRRTKNLFDKQRNYKWLETHIWHAKRFHMVERWGYRLPDRPCDKSLRACYRATSQHCLIQDISYYNCIEIEGEQDIITNHMKLVCDPNVGLSVSAKAYIRGNREGSVMLFNNSKPIGMVYFHWKPSNSSQRRILWIWLHAAFYKEALQCLVECFELKHKSNYVFENPLVNLRLRELKTELNRLRLTGPLANALLQESLKICEANNSGWLTDYFKNDENRKLHLEQSQYWQKIKNITSAQLPPSIILSLTICDPRYSLPKKRTKVFLKPDSNNLIDYNTSIPMSLGPIWDAKLLKLSKENKCSNSDIHNLRSKLLVPGSDLNESGSPLPILLIQRPGNRDEKLAYCSGWDIILPSTWTQPVWLSLILHGGRPGGIRETNSMEFEEGKQTLLQPDTLAGSVEAKRIADELSDTHFKKPPNKRINFIKFAIACPFMPNWKKLVEEWGGIEEFSVLRDLKQLNHLQELLKPKNKKVLLNNLNLNLNCIVPIRVQLKRGKPNQYAIICLPQEKDCMKNCTLMEPYREDENKDLRKEVKNAHKTLLMKLKRKRSKSRKLGEKVCPIDREMYLDFNKKMRELWVPKQKTIRNSCSREVIGFVTVGDYGFTEGKGSGLGFVTVGGIQTLISLNLQNVLVRNTNSRQYRMAAIQITM